MTNKVFYLDNLGNSLEATGGKVNVKPDNTGNVQFEVTEQGIKGNVELPAAFDPSQLNEEIEQVKTAAENAQNTATQATEKNTTQDAEIEQLKVKNTELEQALNTEKAKVVVSDVTNELTEDGIKVTVAKTDSSSSDFTIPKVPVEIHFENATFENGKLKVTLNDGTEKETEFTAEVLTHAINNATPEQRLALGVAIKNLVIGEEVQDFGGVTKGFLIKTGA